MSQVMISDQSPIVILTLKSGKVNPELKASLKAACPVEIISFHWQATKRLTTHPYPRAVIVADGGIYARKNRNVLPRLAQYTKRGGRCIFALNFPSAIRTVDVPTIFREHFELRWTIGGCFRTNTVIQTEFIRFAPNEVPESFNLHAVHLLDVDPVDTWYRSTTKTDADDAPVISSSIAFAAYGHGFVGYVGDINYEPTSLQLIRTMACGYVRSKSSGGAPGVQKPLIFVSALLQQRETYKTYSHLFRSLRMCAEVRFEEKDIFLADFCTRPKPPDCVILIDSGITEEDHDIDLKGVIKYVKNGGRVICAGNFAKGLLHADAQRFFRQWGLPWDAGSFLRTTVHLNARHVAGFNFETLPGSFSVESLLLLNVPSDNAVYKPSETSLVESHVFPPDHIPVNPEESAIAFARVGKGYFGYAGDINGEVATTRTILAMCNLVLSDLDSPPARLQNNTQHNTTTTHTETIRQAGKSLETGSKTVDHGDYKLSPEDQFSASGDEYLPEMRVRPREKEVQERIIKRAAKAMDKHTRAEIKKEEGNKFFKQGLYHDAIDCYQEAIEINGSKPAYQLNLAASHIKLGEEVNFELAEHACYEVLQKEPKNLKARYRRAIAYRGMKDFHLAIPDLKACLKLSPNDQDVIRELETTKRVMKDAKIIYEDDSSDEEGGDPPIDADPESESDDSELSDFYQEGNGIPCRHHNRDGCARKADCKFKHAPSEFTTPDQLGRNVCDKWLIGRCDYESQCWFAHSREYLPEKGWWNEEATMAELREKFDVLRMVSILERSGSEQWPDLEYRMDHDPSFEPPDWMID